MTSSLATKSALAAALIIAGSTAFAAGADAGQFRVERQTPPPQTFGFAAAGGGSSTQALVETCNNVASCNLMISYCVSHGGDWQETGHNGQGQPSSGKCTY